VRGALLCICALVVLCVSARASASGLYLAERGSHGLARGGAYVAGATGLDAVGYNVAGLRGTGVMGDLSLLLLDVRYRRELAIIDSSGTSQSVHSPTVRGNTELLPLPTLVGAYSTHDGHLTVAAGIFSPTFALLSFPSKVDGQASPARYTLSGFSDSRLVWAGAWLAYHPNEQLSLGAGVHALMGTFRSALDFTLSLPDRLLAAPEDPDYDAHGRIGVGPFVAPSGTLGVRYAPISALTFGVSGDLPTWIDSDSTFDVRLPDSVVFDSVSVRGRRAQVHMRLPGVIRAGVQARPFDRLAIELAYVREFWSAHDAIVVEPKGVRIEGIPGGPSSIALPTIRIARGFRDASSYRLGAELDGQLGTRAWFLRTGVSYEESAVPPAYLSLSSLDFDKLMLAVGVGANVAPKLRFDLTFAHLILMPTKVSPREARLTRVNPLSGNATEETVNGGSYRARGNVLSAGFAYLFR